jgi:hypothetical protein
LELRPKVYGIPAGWLISVGFLSRNYRYVLRQSLLFRKTENIPAVVQITQDRQYLLPNRSYVSGQKGGILSTCQTLPVLLRLCRDQSAFRLIEDVFLGTGNFWLKGNWTSESIGLCVKGSLTGDGGSVRPLWSTDLYRYFHAISSFAAMTVHMMTTTRLRRLAKPSSTGCAGMEVDFSVSFKTQGTTSVQRLPE